MQGEKHKPMRSIIMVTIEASTKGRVSQARVRFVQQVLYGKGCQREGEGSCSFDPLEGFA